MLGVPARNVAGDLSLPSRGAWIEMLPLAGRGCTRAVAPLAGSVDRNSLPFVGSRSLPVAPLAGSVDRNIFGDFIEALIYKSLPSRGAWIEISRLIYSMKATMVAPLAGSVDRNVLQ